MLPLGIWGSGGDSYLLIGFSQAGVQGPETEPELDTKDKANLVPLIGYLCGVLKRPLSWKVVYETDDGRVV